LNYKWETFFENVALAEATISIKKVPILIF